MHFFVKMRATHQFQSIYLFINEYSQISEGKIHLSRYRMGEIVLEEEMVLGIDKVEDLIVIFVGGLWRLIHFCQNSL